MESTKKSLVFSLFFFVCLSGALIPLAAQSIPLASEMERLERLAAEEGRNREVFVRLARLSQLSGDREKALEYWLAAAFAEPGKRDDRAMLEAVKILISTGEYGRAGAELRTMLISSHDEETLRTARHLAAQLEAFKNGDYEPLRFLANEPGYRETQGGIFYTLWKISGDGNWKTRLLSAFPRSVEAEIARESSGVKAAFTPQWFLLPPREPAWPGGGLVRTAVPEAPVRDTSVIRLQTGLFAGEDNAQSMAQKLEAVGFKPEITRRNINGNEYWAVFVPAGADMNETINQLKTQGFESFPVF